MKVYLPDAGGKERSFYDGVVLDIIHLGGSGIFGLDFYFRRDFQKSQFGSVHAGFFGGSDKNQVQNENKWNRQAYVQSFPAGSRKQTLFRREKTGSGTDHQALRVKIIPLPG